MPDERSINGHEPQILVSALGEEQTIERIACARLRLYGSQYRTLVDRDTFDSHAAEQFGQRVGARRGIATAPICDIDAPMTTMAPDDPILERFRAALDEIYGDRLERVVLFGSRARGDARIDSDYDVAVFLKSLPDRWAELRVDLLDETGAFFDAKPYLAAAYRERSPLMHEIRREGRDL